MNLEKLKNQLRIMAEADIAVVNMLMMVDLSQELHNEIARNLEEIRKEFDKLEKVYLEVKNNKGRC